MIFFSAEGYESGYRTRWAQPYVISMVISWMVNILHVSFPIITFPHLLICIGWISVRVTIIEKMPFFLSIFLAKMKKKNKLPTSPQCLNSPADTSNWTCSFWEPNLQRLSICKGNVFLPWQYCPTEIEKVRPLTWLEAISNNTHAVVHILFTQGKNEWNKKILTDKK